MRDPLRSTPILRPLEVAPLSFTALALVLVLVPSFDYGHWIGVGASVLAFAVFVPQAARVWHMREDHHALQGVSVVTNMFIVNNSLVWGLYAWAIGEFWVGAAGIVNLPLASMIIVLVVRSRVISRREHPTLTADASPLLRQNSVTRPDDLS